MTPVLIAVVLLFFLLLALRVGGARRAALAQRWPALALAGAALMALVRGAVWPALGLAGLAALAWVLCPTFTPPRPQPGPRPDPADAEACVILGVNAAATEAEIRRAYRTKMARAHPDKGGGHVEAARLTTARDRLLKRYRR